MSAGAVRPPGPAAPEALEALAARHGPRYRMLAGGPPRAEAGDWLRADRLADPDSAELTRLLEAEARGSGHRTAHASALTLIAVYAGRVTAAAVLQWALDGRVWDVSASNVLVRPSAHGIGGVRLREPGQCTPTLAALRRTVLDTHLLPLADALHRRTRAGLRQLYGGVAHGCATALCASRVPDTRQLARRWTEFTAAAPELARLGEVVEVVHDDGGPRLHYLRRTCCLFHTSAEAVRCASCCLTPREERLRAYAAAPGLR